MPETYFIRFYVISGVTIKLGIKYLNQKPDNQINRS